MRLRPALMLGQGVADDRHTGTVAHWNASRGVGFIKPNGGGDNVFCNVAGIMDGS